MSDRYYAPSGAQGAAEAIQALMLQRAIDERQRMLDAQAQADRVGSAQREQKRIELEQQRIADAQADRKRDDEDREKERKFRRATTKATIGLPGVATEADYQEAQDEGYGTQYRRDPASTLHGYDEAGAAQEVPIPGVVQFLGGTQYQQARAAEAARKDAALEAERIRDEQLATTLAAKKEQDAKDNDIKMSIAGLAASGRNANADLQREILQGRIDTAEEKKTAAKTAADAQRAAVADKAQNVMNLIGQLGEIDPKTFKSVTKLSPGVERLYGVAVLGRTPGMLQGIVSTETSDARAAMDQLMGTAVTDFLGELKAQSRTGATGFGALSEGELKLVQDVSSQLRNPKLSSERVRSELSRLLKMAKEHYDKAMAAPGGSGVRITKIEPLP